MPFRRHTELEERVAPGRGPEVWPGPGSVGATPELGRNVSSLALPPPQ